MQMKEIEVKILEINPEKIRKILKKHRANIVMPKNLQINEFYKNAETKKSGVTLRLRKNILGNTIAIKSKLRFVKGHKVMHEYETKIEDFEKMKKAVELLGFKQIGAVEAMREDWKFNGCLVSIVKLPNIPIYVEIEGTKSAILKIAKLFGYSEKDYYPKIIYEKYNIKTRFWRFKK